ncbi:MAG: hypothetical protein QNK23_09300 [Crocinitomicaceae bacterium]|nr:hypothetical protein [Crocinitomicaceae bacterium]
MKIIKHTSLYIVIAMASLVSHYASSESVPSRKDGKVITADESTHHSAIGNLHSGSGTIL